MGFGFLLVIAVIAVVIGFIIGGTLALRSNVCEKVHHNLRSAGKSAKLAP